MQKTFNRIFALGGLIFLTIVFLLLFRQGQIAQAAAPIGIPASVATTSTSVIGPTVAINNLRMGSTTNETYLQCASRIISTSNSAIMLAFSSAASTSLSGTVGNWQAASTTVAYDSGLYGCGYWTVYAYATTTLTITETR